MQKCWLTRLTYLLLALVAILEMVFGTSYGRLFLCLLVLPSVLLWTLTRYGLSHPHWQGPSRIVRRIMHWGAGLILLSFLAVQYQIYHWQAPEPQAAPYLVVLGAGLKGDQPSAMLQERLKLAATILHQQAGMQVLVSGGKGDDELITEAQAMQNYLQAAGIAPQRILREEASRNTRENILNSHALLAARHGGKSPAIWLLTSDFHLYRASHLASRIGWVNWGIAAHTPWQVVPYCSVREYLSLLRDQISE